MGEVGVDFSLKRQKQFTKEIFHEHVETVFIISCDHEIMIVQSQENKAYYYHTGIIICYIKITKGSTV